MEEKQKLMKNFSHLMYYIFIQETTCELLAKLDSVLSKIILVRHTIWNENVKDSKIE
jgi:hypothetical protein